MKRTTHALAALIGPLLLPWLAGCPTTLPRGYKGDFSEFREAQAAREAEKAEREARKLEEAAARAPAADEPSAGPQAIAMPPLMPIAPPPEGFELRLDPEIARDVRDALAETALIKDRNLAVTVQGGLVILEGIVGSVEEAIAAVFAASAVDGVRGVYDLLELPERQEVGADIVVDNLYSFSQEGVTWEDLRTMSLSDFEVQRAVETAYNRTPEIDAIDVLVSVENGVVVLSGRVSSSRERQAAANLARKATNRVVKNQLEVRPLYEPVRPRKKAPL